MTGSSKNYLQTMCRAYLRRSTRCIGYKTEFNDGSKPVQFGLVAEEVAEAFPELVVENQEHQPEPVKYHLLSTLLLNELQKQHRINQEQATQLARLETQVRDLDLIKAQIAEMAALQSRK